MRNITIATGAENLNISSGGKHNILMKFRAPRLNSRRIGLIYAAFGKVINFNRQVYNTCVLLVGTYLDRYMDT